MTIRVRTILVLAVTLATMGLASCDHYTCGTGAEFGSSTCTSSGTGLSSGGGGVTGNNVTAFVYFEADDALAVDGLNVNDSGTFEVVEGFATPTFAANSNVIGVVGVNKQYLYVPVTNNTVYGYSINGTDGALTGTPNSPYTSGASFSGIGSTGTQAADPASRFLFVSGAGGISVFTVSSTDGSLTLTPGSPFSTGGILYSQLATDGLGKYLYAVQKFPGSNILAFSVNQTTGALTPVEGSPFAFNMSSISGESTGQFLLGVTENYGLDGGIVDNHVYVFGITQSGTSAGALAQVSGSPFATINPPINLAVNPNGAFVYTFNESAAGTDTVLDAMEGYTLSSSGSLTAMSTSPFTGLNAVIGRFDQSGQYLIALAAPTTDTGGTYVYDVDTSSGALTSSSLPFTGSPSVNYAVTDAP